MDKVGDVYFLFKTVFRNTQERRVAEEMQHNRLIIVNQLLTEGDITQAYSELKTYVNFLQSLSLEDISE